MFFSLEKKVFSWTYLLKKTPRRTKYIISPVIRDAVISPKIRDILFKLIQIEVQCCKNYFKISLSQEFGASRNNLEKEPHKPHPNWKITNIEIYKEYLLFSASGIILQFCKVVLSL